ncbi:MAG: response regulator [Archangium sp.]|nr:response regulator [Archangium sp.]
MSKPLRVLIIEDVESDAELLVRELKLGGYKPTWERVETLDALKAAITGGQKWDVIVSDYSGPRFSAPAALKVVRDTGTDVPFIIVSGTVGEETAVEAMRAGANDFMVKGKYARLIAAIERERRDVGLRAEQQSMREQLLVSDRLASIGALAAGVAHEINNPLAALMANLDVVLQDLGSLLLTMKASDAAPAVTELLPRVLELDEPLRDARESADRVRLIVRDLKVLSRGDEEKRGPVDVKHVIESSLRMARNEIRHRAKLVTDFADVPAVFGNDARLGQVFLNLVMNAAQAVPEGRANENEIRVSTKRDGPDWVVVEVKDSGVGIPEAVLGRIFDPFFSTKPIGVGTGLGLAICQRIVHSLNGRLLVESEVGRGTTFRVVLPVAPDDDTEEVEIEPMLTPTRRATILLVDDERLLGVALRRALQHEHDVTVVTDVREALDRLRAGARFDIILTDVMMPHQTGADLYAELTRLAPDQAARVVFITGGAFTSVARDFLGQVPNLRLEKPFELSELRGVIARVVDGTPSAVHRLS